MLATPSAFAPASNVSATTLAWVGIPSQFRPPRPVGTGFPVIAAAEGPPEEIRRPAASSEAAAASGTHRAALAIRRMTGGLPPRLPTPRIE
jgi:hypothetical protein